MTPNTLADALSALWLVYPGLRDRIATEQGDIRTHINIFVGDNDIRFKGGLTCRIPDGAEISIVPNITGGCDLHNGTSGTAGTQPCAFQLGLPGATGTCEVVCHSARSQESTSVSSQAWHADLVIRCARNPRVD